MSALPLASRLQPVLDRLSTRKEQWRRAAVQGPVTAFLFEFLSFGIKQAWACLFGGLFLGALISTHLWYPAGMMLARYDVLVAIAILIQALLLWLRLESWEEAKVIFLFHIVGTVMEIFKTHMGSWTYPEENLLRIGGVPLFSGFMYACVGSYIARIWRIMDFRFVRYPPRWTTLVLAAAIYINFFSHHYVADLRWGLIAAVLLLFGPCIILYRPDRAHRRMPLVLGFFLVALFIWLAENIATFARAWVYPSQQQGWHLVDLSKLTAWFLLMIISFVLVALVHPPRRPDGDAAPVKKL